MNEIYLRLVSDDDGLTPEDLERLLANFVATIPGSKISMFP